ncbi:flagellar hook assembly protein FlgD [Zavarzinia sp. CC-PAN008]|uniref:flagellar hook assembly protein FlgD n=1 Tax=Zavarzinia sp. CC-PAN008 TaxID=3243332 RepID=UPI003F74A0C0
MDVNSATSAATAAAAGSKSATAGATLATTFDTFLTLLTTQLQNQDPLNPMDSAEFTNQLVNFSGVEQQINTNSNLENLITLVKGTQAQQAAAYIGKTVNLDSDTAALKNGAAYWSYDLEDTAKVTVLTITNSSGQTVWQETGETAAGRHDLTWDGKDASGTALPDGSYTLTVSALTDAGVPVKTDIAVTGRVSAVEVADGETYVVVDGNRVKLSDVTSIRETS